MSLWHQRVCVSLPVNNNTGKDMKKDLNIEEKCQRAIVVKPVNWEQRIGKEKARRNFAVSMALLNVKLRTTKSTTEK